LLLAKGYGYSGFEKKVPVSPENTLFRRGSISELFTWTSMVLSIIAYDDIKGRKH
jgi:CubicO group peptidase (beta-lactamase class C family)